jgi:hypothetical protein
MNLHSTCRNRRFPAIFMTTYLLAILPSYAKEIPKEFSIVQFDKWDYKKQAQFINALDKRAKMKFMSLFLQDRLFALPPVARVLFLRNGEFIYQSERDEPLPLTDKFDEFSVGRWKYENDQIIIETERPDTAFGKREIWDDVWIDKEDLGHGSAILAIHISEEQKHDGTKGVDFENSLHDWCLKGDFSEDVRMRTFAEIRLKSSGQAPRD